MAEKEVEIINHLLEVEQNAAALTLQAQEDADKKISVAKAKAESAFKTEFEQLVKKYEDECEKKLVEIESKSKNEIKNFKAEIENSKKTTAEFNLLLDKILFA